MNQVVEHFSKADPDRGQIQVLLSLLPPPISLDLLCTISGQSPVKVLQIAEAFTAGNYLSRDPEKGAGYYYLADLDAANDFLATVPEEDLHPIARKAVSGIFDYYSDTPKRWLTLAYIYQVSHLPVRHHHDLISAGRYCLDRKLPVDAAVYFRMALEAMEKTRLDTSGQKDFIDAAIDLCTSRDSSLHKGVQRTFLFRALKFCADIDDPVRKIRLLVLIAKAFLKTDKSAQGTEYLEQAWKMLGEHDYPHEIRLQVALANSEMYFWQGYISKAIERYESVLGNHEELPEDVETLKSYLRLGWAYSVAGETARAIGLIRAARRKARQIDARDLERYATLIFVIVLAESGRIDEGEVFLDELLSTPPELLDPYTLWPGNGKAAYFAYLRGNYEKAFAYQKKAYENSKKLGYPHHRGSDNLEIMLGLEKRGMVHPEWNFETDSTRLLTWPDIYMQGVAYRFRALKAHEEGEPREAVVADLKKGIKLLTRAGAKIELGHAMLLMARIRLSENRPNAVERLVKKAWDIFSKVNPDLFPKDLKPHLDRASKNALWVRSLLNVGNALGSIRVRSELLNQIIKQAMRIANAERGAIFIRQGADLEMVASRNMEAPTAANGGFDAEMTFVEQVCESGSEIVQDFHRSSQTRSLETRGTGWMGCFPIQLQGRVMGAIFMDCEFAPSRLSEDEICLLRIISNQAAVALENLEAYEDIIDLNSNLEAQTRFYRESFETGLPDVQMIGRSGAFRRMLESIQQVAHSDTTVMITGETGVGKDLVAQSIHQHGNRAAGPFIAVNLVSLSPELIASELFGHEKGAFTGALRTRKGRFELASEGTLFLDDIDAFSLDIQAKMLRVLETRTFERVGGTRTMKTRFRLVAASNRNIEELVEQGLFRSDFYYRLNVFPIRVPALRDRVEDIPALAHYFMRLFAKKFDKTFDTITKKDMHMLINYHWPGNVRELRHVIERAVLLSGSGRLSITPLDASPAFNRSEEQKILPLREMEARHIVRALSRCRGKVSGPGGAAALLDLKPTTLYSKMKRLGIERDAYRLKKTDAPASGRSEK
jgi:transcriptional regulator with GAF, ATPase, and Fis domain/tetratricopeptide (TPR) repeat protein